MNAVIQRVSKAWVDINDKRVAEIEGGLLILLGIKKGDGAPEAEFLAKKIANLRIFEDENGKMNLSILEIDRDILVVPNFTLLADAKKGNRPSYTGAAKPDEADSLFRYFTRKLKELKINKVDAGVFGGDMKVSLTNDGPVTIILDTDILMPKKG